MWFKTLWRKPTGVDGEKTRTIPMSGKGLLKSDSG